jgi:hypothetical protein
MPREYLLPPSDRRSHPYLASSHPRPQAEPQAEPEQLEATYHDLARALVQISKDSDEVPQIHPPPERLQCAACHIPIIVPSSASTGTVDHLLPSFWRLAHCRHPLHLDCLAPLGHPYAINRTTQHPYYVHNPGFFISPYVIPVM